LNDCHFAFPGKIGGENKLYHISKEQIDFFSQRVFGQSREMYQHIVPQFVSIAGFL